MVFKFFKKKAKKKEIAEDIIEKAVDAIEEISSATEVASKIESKSDSEIIENTSNVVSDMITDDSEKESSENKDKLIKKEVTIKTPENTTQIETQTKPKSSYFSRLKSGLAKTSAGIGNIFLGKKEIDEDLLEDLETALLMADVGIEATQKITEDITQAISRKELNNHDTVITQLKQSMKGILSASESPLVFTDKKPYVLLMVGINGAGKTTTIGKISQKLANEGKSVMLAAGDTFRAAAVEQLKTWGERAKVPVISQGTGADAASVIYDAYQSAVAKDIDVLIADTAGRLHTQSHLMDEIKKIVRVIKKANPEAPHEIMLVIDAGNGQNALNQAKEFNKVLGLTGITITKLDGTAKGGIIFSIATNLNLPVRFIGVGESTEDLREFNTDDFIDALLADIK